MAGASAPQPDKILNYPQNGELTFLFRKKLTRTDFRQGLILPIFSSDYRSLPRPLLDAVAEGGLMVWCYTPAIHHGVVLKNHQPMPAFQFKKSGWQQIVAANQLVVGQLIDCWALYDAEDGPHGKLSFLLQTVGDSGAPHEAASVGAETSGES